MSKSYVELLRDPKWQRKRLEIMDRDGFRCTSCLDDTTTLNVHHKRYKPHAKPWEYSSDDLTTLCETCHRLTTEALAILKNHAAQLSACTVSKLAGIAVGLQFVDGYSPPLGCVEIIDYDMASGVAHAIGMKTDDLLLLVQSDGKIDFEKLRAEQKAADDRALSDYLARKAGE